MRDACIHCARVYLAQSRHFTSLTVRIEAAKDADMLDADATLIDMVQDEGEREALREQYRLKRAELTGDIPV